MTEEIRVTVSALACFLLLRLEVGIDEENPFLEMFGMTAIAANISGSDAEGFLLEAGDAERVTMRVTDQFDGETHEKDHGILSSSIWLS